MSALLLLLALNVTQGNAVRRVEAVPVAAPVPPVCSARPDDQPRAPKGWRPYTGRVNVALRRAADRQLVRWKLGQWHTTRVREPRLGLLSELHCWPEKGWHRGVTVYTRAKP